MIDQDPAEAKRHTNTGTILSVLSSLILVTALLCFFAANDQWIFILTIFGMILGNSAFNHFEKAAELKPQSPIRHSLEYFDASLKKGTQCTILVDLYYPIEDDGIDTLTRIRALLQRAFSISLPEIETLSENPYPQIDFILQSQIHSICKEIGLTTLALKTINVKTGITEKAPGIFLREE